MGWLWASANDNTKDASNASDANGASGVALTEAQKERIFGKPTAPKNVSPARNQPDDAELDAFLKSFSAPGDTDGRAESAASVTATSNSQQAEPLIRDRIRADGSLDISPNAIYPRSMSCRQAFDQAFYCQSLGGKFNDIYRYGHLRPCSEQWGAWFFCMRTRTLPEKERQKAVVEYYAERDARRKKEFGTSSTFAFLPYSALGKIRTSPPGMSGVGK